MVPAGFEPAHPKIVELKSTASEGIASFFVEFDVSQDLDKALTDVREAVDAAKAEMPDAAEEPFVEEMTADDFPMLQVNLLSDGVSEQVVYREALRLRQQIEAIPSVLSAELQGHRDEVLEVIIDPDALNAYRISVEELVVVLQRNNRLIPAGTVDLDSGRFAVKVPAVVEARNVNSIDRRQDAKTQHSITRRCFSQVKSSMSSN